MAPPPKKPNILVMVADDLGFSDTGPYGSEIATPYLDRLAREGLRMTDFHTAASCSPTRAMLLSGTDSHIAGLGAMAEWMNKAPEVFAGRAGYEGYLNKKVAAMPEVLQENGYFTVMSGKWHLGLTKELAPCSKGFDRSFTFLPGAGNHYNNEPQLEGKPTALLKGEGRGFWMENERFLDPHEEVPKPFYSSTTFTEKLIGFLDERTGEEREKPFFAYLPFTAPHWPLQAPREKIDKYRGQYDDGPHALRDRRLVALQREGLVPADVIPAPLHTMRQKPWDEMNPEEQKRSARAMEIYAAMVDVMDENIGKVLSYLTSTDELDDTFVVFMSDNGAEGNMLEAVPVLAGATLDAVIAKYYDNSFENLGNANSFVWYGPQWASAATAPSRGVKSYSTEGGIRCPCIVRYPAGLKRAGGSISHAFTTVMDVLPTVLELAGLAHPAPWFQGREVAGLRGRSWGALLAAAEDDVVAYDEEAPIVAWEQIGVAAVRRGQWKAVFLPPPKGKGGWELYDLSRDLGEIDDLSEREPAKLKEMMKYYETYFQETGMFDSYELYYRAVKANGKRPPVW
ncbi:uncharacterized protein K452DRAFT_268447 [Aplosporella prunicola CBS 121167]|uniref:Sulfatase N-terminal domain-containing protein n=1 Tax=Aplosporella prunicola CBS 121167 TaxID=1176127 RepID=A0A6A6BJX5_9PEZI|nr:uncharacterized protein K452DRAFT_268447 [Aplosporella prunicola CBS 121167]KAF2143938.1 hypothetical protein K452DRAFT_268447 [Aplosporella prunicola CBS 121167]